MINRASSIQVFLCGDVMSGRGIDQILPHPADPELHEPYVPSALEYVRLAEARNGPMPRPASFAYPWGAALEELERSRPDVRIVNLETSVTVSDAFEAKGINYRMNPRNAPFLKAARPDLCVLANNHVLDWGREGLLETLETLRRCGIAFVGAGGDAEEAQSVAAIGASSGARVLVAAMATASSGVPQHWAAEPGAPGVNLIDFSHKDVARLARRLRAVRREGDVAIASIHWGGNWGYDIPRAQREFAHALIDRAGVDVVHGHSSHHPKAMEVYRGKLVLYGCGDFLNDYEGIAGYEEFRGDLALMYFPTLETATGRLAALALKPLRIRRFRLESAAYEDAVWLRDRLNREGARFGFRLQLDGGRELKLHWTAS